MEFRRPAEFITPIPKPRKRKAPAAQQAMVFDEGAGISTAEQEYDPTSLINELRRHVDRWRLSSSGVTPETARLLDHWRHHSFSSLRPFFCQIEAVETAIWLTEVAPNSREGKRFLDHLADANQDANPELMRLALKLATGAGKTTVMAMLIAWQTINAVRRPQSNRFTRGFLVVTPGITIKDRLRVLQPNDPDSYYASRELVPGDMLEELNRAKIVICVTAAVAHRWGTWSKAKLAFYQRVNADVEREKPPTRREPKSRELNRPETTSAAGRAIPLGIRYSVLGP
jgi:type III restriction enzyme